MTLLIFAARKCLQSCAMMLHLQSAMSLWHDLRFARITASKIFKASRCKTDDGSRRGNIWSESSRLETEARKGLGVVETKIGKKMHLIILVLNSDIPMIRASLDGIFYYVISYRN